LVGAPISATNTKVSLAQKVRATFLNYLPDYPIRQNGQERWVENPTKKFVRGIYDTVSEPIRNGQWSVPHSGNDKTAYIIGLFGSGRLYINALILQNFGQRARYLRPIIRFHPGPTSMIYSGHATMKYASRGQKLPVVTNRIMEAVRSGYADLIFVYRHPLDSLITNWLWWRTYLREKRFIDSISDVYKTTDELCAALDRDFQGFKAFAEGHAEFFASTPGPRFLSFTEFVEETELYLRASTLSLRLEDFMIDPSREFRKLVELMSVQVDLDSASLPPPRAKPYGYLRVQETVPQFKDFIEGLDFATKDRIEKIGYTTGLDRIPYRAALLERACSVRGTHRH
jgi:hypothetical protein